MLADKVDYAFQLGVTRAGTRASARSSRRSAWARSSQRDRRHDPRLASRGSTEEVASESTF